MSRRRVGRVAVDFDVIERFAAEAEADLRLAEIGDRWTISRGSSLHRRKDGSHTLVLIWVCDEGHRFVATYRGLRLEAA